MDGYFDPVRKPLDTTKPSGVASRLSYDLTSTRTKARTTPAAAHPHRITVVFSVAYVEYDLPVNALGFK